MKLTPNRNWIAGPLVIGLATLGTMGVLQAQPDVNNAPKGDNPIAKKRGGKGKVAKMTPEQRDAMRQKMQEQMQQRRETNLRTTLTEAGFTEKTLQDAVVAFANEQSDVNNNDTRDKMRQLNQAVRKNAADKEIQTLLDEIREANEEAKEKRENALKALDTKISYSKNLRLEAVLTLAGITGENVGGAGGRGGAGAGRGGAKKAAAGA